MVSAMDGPAGLSEPLFKSMIAVDGMGESG